MWFEQSSDVDLGRPTVAINPHENAVTLTWCGPRLAVVLNPAEARELAEAIVAALDGDDE